jgi:hypothetical protein
MLFLAGRFWLETVVGLGVLALAGGWVLWPFRNTERRYLYLAAPSAGIAVVALTLTILCITFHLSVPVAVMVSLPLLCAPTLVCLLRWRRQGGKLERWLLPLVLVVGISGWGTYCCNRTAILAGEPTISMMNGTDAFGYAQIADHYLCHPGILPVWSPTRPHEAYPHACENDPRQGAFLLTAAAAWVQHEGALYAYDWAAGVALAAGILALAGAFPSTGIGLVVLVAAGAVSPWLTYSRSGYYGKLLAYPGCLLLVSILLATWQDFSPRRLLACAVLGYGLALCHSPVTPAAVLVLALFGVAITLIHHSVFGRQRLDFVSPDSLLWLVPARGALVGAVVVGPFLVLYPEYILHPPMPPAPSKHRILAISLGLDNANIPIFERTTIFRFIGFTVMLQAILWLVAYRAGSVVAQGLFLSLMLVPLLLLQSPSGLYQLAGFPGLLSVLGVVALLTKLRRDRQPRWLQWGVVALGVVLIALRVPQGKAAYEWYVKKTPDAAIFRQSEIETLVRLVGDHRVDLRTRELYSGIFAMQELGPRVRLQIHDPTWHLVLAYSRWDVPCYPAPGDFVITDPGEVPPAEACCTLTHFQLARRSQMEPATLKEPDEHHPATASALAPKPTSVTDSSGR